jgi:PEP-CTERM motif
MTTGGLRKRGVAMCMLLAVLVVAFAHQASADVINCPASFTADGTAKVHDGATLPTVETAASACQYLSPPDNSVVANETTVNNAAFFGFSDWSFAGIEQEEPLSGLSGTWAIPAAFLDFGAFDYMLTFKDGRDTNLISFLLNEQFSSGGWSTPFTNPPFDVAGPKAVSHFSLFSRPEAAVPEPSTLALLGLGVILAGLARRKTA